MAIPVRDEAVEDVTTSPNVRAPSGSWGAFRWALELIGWGVVIVLAVFALLRIVAWDSLEPLIVINSLTFVVYLPIWLVAIGAALGRRWWLLGAALVVVAAQVVFVAPEFLAASPLPPWTRHAPIVRLFDANVDKSTIFDPGYVHAIEADHADVISFEEFTPQDMASLTASGLLRSFPYQCPAPAPGAIGFFVGSRWRMVDCQYRTVQSHYVPTPYMVEATLTTPAGPVALRVVHTLAPFPLMSTEWRLALAAVNSSIRASGTGRMLMTGDFNATWGNRAFVTLLGDGLTDGAAARGQALDMTWPNGAIVPPFVRIDHVLTGSSLAVVKIASGSGFGSDHHYLTAEVAVKP